MPMEDELSSATELARPRTIVHLKSEHGHIALHWWWVPTLDARNAAGAATRSSCVRGAAFGAHIEIVPGVRTARAQVASCAKSSTDMCPEREEEECDHAIQRRIDDEAWPERIDGESVEVRARAARKVATRELQATCESSCRREGGAPTRIVELEPVGPEGPAAVHRVDDLSQSVVSVLGTRELDVEARESIARLLDGWRPVAADGEGPGLRRLEECRAHGPWDTFEDGGPCDDGACTDGEGEAEGDANAWDHPACSPDHWHGRQDTGGGVSGACSSAGRD
jgi:hypothetical protein